MPHSFTTSQENGLHECGRLEITNQTVLFKNIQDKYFEAKTLAGTTTHIRTLSFMRLYLPELSI